MKNKIIKLSLLLCMVSTISCKKFLDRSPLSAATDENFWKNESEANSALAGGYGLLRAALTDGWAYFSYGDFPTDEFSSIGYEDLSQVSLTEWNIPISATATYRPMYKLRRYDNFYRVIDQATRCINFIPTIPASGFASPETAEENRKAFIGEAHFLRAFAYFYMARVWGGVPIVREVPTKLGESENLARATEAEIVAFARDEVNKAIGMLSWGYTNSANRAVRANKGAAYALLAHLEAWADNYDASAAAAGEVISKGGYQFMPMANYLTIWKGQSQEGIFEISANKAAEGTERLIGFFTNKAPYLETNTGNAIARLDIIDLNQKFPDSTKDLRIQNAFAFVNAASTDPNCIKYSNFTYLTTNANGVKGNAIENNNIVVFRLSDIVLLRAEALAATGKFSEARVLLNQIRNKARPGNDYAGADANLFAEVIAERSRELFLEGHRYYDLVRLAREKNIFEFGNNSGSRIDAAAFAAGKQYWPIDPTLMTLNPKLLQTPFWADKM